MAATRETEALKPIDKVRVSRASNQSGCNESEPRCSLVNANYQMAEPLVVR